MVIFSPKSSFWSKIRLIFIMKWASFIKLTVISVQKSGISDQNTSFMNHKLWCEIAIFGVRNSLQKYICNNKRNLFIHKRLNKLSWIICIWIGLSFNWQNQADKAQETNLKRVQVRSTSFRPFSGRLRTSKPSTVIVESYQGFW